MEEAERQFRERIEQHPIHGLIAEIIDLIAKAPSERAPSPAAAGHFHRLTYGLEKVRRALATADIWLIGGGLIKELHRGVAPIKDQVLAWRSTGDDSNLQTANEQLGTTLLPLLAKLPRSDSAVEAAALAETAQLQISENRKLEDEWRGRRDELLAGWRDASSAALSQLTEAIGAAQRLSEQVSKQEERIEKIVERSDAAVAEINQKASDAETNRSQRALETEAARTERFEQASRELASQLETRIRQIESTANEANEALESQTAEMVKRLAAHEKQATELLQLIGDKGVTAPFKNTADSDRRAALFLRWLAGVFFAGMVIIVVLAARDIHTQITEGKDVPWGGILFRILSGFIFSVPAYYFAREASKFQAESDRNRRVQLELASLGPFIEHLEGTKRDELKVELTRRYFGTPHVAPELEKSLDPKDLIDLIREALKRK